MIKTLFLPISKLSVQDLKIQAKRIFKHAWAYCNDRRNWVVPVTQVVACERSLKISARY